MRVYGILAHPQEDLVLLVRDGGAWTLPSITFEDDAEEDPEPGVISRAFTEALHADVGILRTAAHVASCGVYELEAEGDPSGVWRTPGDLGDGELARVAEAALRDRRHPHPLRPAWERPGWMSVLGAWIDERLAGTGAERTRMDIVRTWSISTVVRVETSAGRMYAKAAPPFFAAEPSITEALGARFPGAVPEIVAGDPQRGLLLMSEVAAAEDGGGDRSLVLLSTMQLALAGDARFLLGAGCADRRLASLPHAFDELVDDPLTRELVPPEDVEELRRLEQSIRGACGELASLGIPDTLVHGDFHDSNVLPGPVIIDWTDAALAHPFFDLPTWFRFKRPGDDPVGRRRTLDVYLAPWREAHPNADLDRAVELAERLGLVYHAVTYLRIVRATEPASRWQFERMVPGLIGRLTGSRYRDRA